MMRTKPEMGGIYHIYNRGVEKRKIFLDDQDYLRFVHDLFEFNDQNPAINLAYYFGKSKSKEVGLPKIERGARKLFVRLMAFCLMPNHFHLIVQQITDDGITEFIRKLGTGYTNYFNKKYRRVGPLFQGKYKSVQIKSESHLIHLPYYIHLNPLDVAGIEWRGEKVINYKKASEFLEKYRWSSYRDYIGIRNFPSVTQREFLTKFFDGPENYRKRMIKWLKERDVGDLETVVFK